MSEAPRKRGRPRAYDPDAALERARDVFWEGGFAGSSLDALSAATAMNRPSLYGAFGDKEALYLRTLERYRDESLVAIRQALDPGRSLREGLGILYATALSTYLDERAGARGCLLIGTAAVEAVLHPAVREVLHGSLAAFERGAGGAVPPGPGPRRDRRGADPATLARLAAAVLHSLAVRARPGEARAMLEAIADSGVAMICAAAGAA